MRPPLPKRAFIGAFSLLEVLITIALIGIIAALLTPKLLEARQESVRQVIRQQTKLYEQALADWFSAQPSAAAASKAWDSSFSGTTGFANASSVLTAISPYIQVANPNGISVSATSMDTTEMKQATLPSGGSYIGGGTGADSNRPWAHIRFYWTPDSTTTPAVNERLERSPQVILFLPQL